MGSIEDSIYWSDGKSNPGSIFGSFGGESVEKFVGGSFGGFFKGPLRVSVKGFV